MAALALSTPADAATIPVTKTSDTGIGSLRQAIFTANTTTEADVVDAGGVTGTISLLTPLPPLVADVEIRGPGPSSLTVRRGSAVPFRIFTIKNLLDTKISGLTIANGDSGPGFSHGGGILLDGNLGTLTVEDTVLTGNTASEGGGLSNGGPSNAGATVIVRNSAVVGNTTVFSAGGIENAFGTLTLEDSTVSGNTAGFSGGGIVHRGTMKVTNSTVSGNTAGERAGGISSGGNNTVLTVRNSTVSGNSAPEGANLHDAGLNPSASLQSTIISNPQGGGANCFVGPPPATLISVGHNLASDASCNLTAVADRPSTDPMLGPLQASGGTGQTMAPLPGSPAIDQGISGGLTTDQRGFRRPVVFPQIITAPGGDGSDIGAIEVQSLPPPDNDFTFGKLKRNLRKGTARLTVNLPGPGELALGGRRVKALAKHIAGAPQTRVEATLIVRASGKSKRRLRRTGKAKLKVSVTYTPTGGGPNTKSRKVSLRRKQSRHSP